MVLAAVTQLTSGPTILENASIACSLIAKAASQGAQAVFLPEATDFIAPGKSVPSLTRSKENREFVQRIREEAKKGKTWVSVGIHEAPEIPWLLRDEEQTASSSGSAINDEEDGKDRCYNTHLLIDDAGAIRCRYRKAHLFDVDIPTVKIRESDTTIKGSQLEAPIQTSIGKIGALTCYDLRFPEASLSLRRQGSQIILYPSAFASKTGAAHWSTLLRARAIETQSWIIASAQVGLHPTTNRESWGEAMIVDPWGHVRANCGTRKSPHFELVDIDLDDLESLRSEMPLWDQRRSDLYPIV